MGDNSRYSKYFGVAEGPAGERLIWPGTVDGFPIRSRGNAPLPLLQRHEMESLPVVYDARVRVFDLSNAEDLQAYQQILDRAANGWYHIRTYRDVYDPEIKNWRVRLEWIEIYGEIPNTKIPPDLGANDVNFSTWPVSHSGSSLHV